MRPPKKRKAYRRFCLPVCASLLLVLVTWGTFSGRAQAAPSCLNADNQCKPDALCTFRAQLAEKVFLYQMYLRNSQVTRRMPGQKREGIRYDGALYDASIKEAQERFPNDSLADQRIKAGQVFQQKLRAHAERTFAIPACSSGQLQRSMLPREGYAGMFTNQHCQVRVSYLGGDYAPEGFGANHATQCQEFYDRDRAHEVIHQRTCHETKARNENLDDIGAMIEDEVAAYRHSVLLSKAYVKLLSIQCSAQPYPTDQQARAQRIQSLLSSYLGTAGTP